MDYVLLFVGILTSIILGLSMPAIIVVFGDMTDSMITEAAIENLIDENWGPISLICPGQSQEEVLEDPSCLM